MKLEQVGPYRVERELARGGMGVVYLAHDPRLDRTVALKALPADLAGDPDRLDRLAREAKLLASLNHPNIGAIHDVVVSDGHRYLALEHIDGETLAERLARGALPIGEAVEICLQIANGMEAAHERGVIHRDLKPGNVMITPDDHVKVVDFGLAKGIDAPESGLLDSPAVSSPTITSPAYSPGTIPGVILGTAPYLSPEQARGRPVDRRTDIWAWGCILYECLAGRRAFEGETVSDTVASILKQEPDWSALPRETPARVRELLRLCLEKDPRRRLRDIGDARIALMDSGSAEPAASRSPMIRFRSRRVAFGFLLGVVACVAAGVWLGTRGGPTSGSLTHSTGVVNLSVPIPGDLRYQYSRITPDGRTILIFATSRDGASPDRPRPHVYRRDLSGRTFEGIPGTERATSFILSPDGSSICFLAPASEHSTQLRIYRTGVRGNAPVTLVSDFPGDRASLAWADEKTLIATAVSGKDYVLIPLDGTPPSKPIPLAIPGMDTAQIGVMTGSNIFGRGVFLYTITYERNAFRYGAAVLDLKTRTAKMLVRDATSPRYAGGYMLFTRDSTLFAAPFDIERLALKGTPFPILSGLQTTADRISSFHIAPNGTMVYALGTAAARRVVRIGPSGDVTDWAPDRRNYRNIALSRDASRLVLQITNDDLLDEIWMSELRRASLRKLVPYTSSDCLLPTWSPDGSLVVFARRSRSADDGVYVVPANGGGSPRRICAVPQAWPDGVFPVSALPGSDQVLGLAHAPGKVGLVSISLNAASVQQLPIEGASYFYSAQFSPDGRWLAYTSDEDGALDLHVRERRADGSLGEPSRLSSGGATAISWAPDGKVIYYVAPGPKIMAVTLAGRVDPEPKLVREVSDLIEATHPFAALPDGSLMALLNDERQDEVRHVEVTLNLFDELNARKRQASH